MQRPEIALQRTTKETLAYSKGDRDPGRRKDGVRGYDPKDENRKKKKKKTYLTSPR